MSQESRVVIDDALTGAVAAILGAHAIPANDARCGARCLLVTDLRGVGWHGVSRVPIHLDRLRRGMVKAAPRMVLDGLIPIAARLDADDALGFVAATRSMAEAVDMARDHGMGMCAVRRSMHVATTISPGARDWARAYLRDRYQIAV